MHQAPPARSTPARFDTAAASNFDKERADALARVNAVHQEPPSRSVQAARPTPARSSSSIPVDFEMEMERREAFARIRAVHQAPQATPAQAATAQRPRPALPGPASIQQGDFDLPWLRNQGASVRERERKLVPCPRPVLKPRPFQVLLLAMTLLSSLVSSLSLFQGECDVDYSSITMPRHASRQARITEILHLPEPHREQSAACPALCHP